MFQLSDKDLRRFWSKVSVPQANGCQPWLKSVMGDGYPGFGLNGTKRAARVACFIAYGEAPADRPYVLHSCTNKLCVAAAHLKWGTPAQNQADRRRDGTANVGEANPASKLTVEDVRLIKARLAAGDPQSEIGREFGVSQGSISMIAIGRNWGWVR